MTRSWTDANGNYTPDCDLISGSAQDLRGSGGDFCGAISNQNFGKNVYSLSYDEQILKGWGVRPSDWIIGATVQHELIPRVSLSVGYTRRWLKNFTVTDNRATTAADYTPFSITAPADSRLPGGGGYLVSGLYNLNPNKVGVIDNYSTFAGNYGNQIDIYACGVMMYECLTGRRPYHAANYNALLMQILTTSPRPTSGSRGSSTSARTRRAAPPRPPASRRANG